MLPKIKIKNKWYHAAESPSEQKEALHVPSNPTPLLDDNDNPIPASTCICAAHSNSECICGAWSGYYD
jgi:hypothetical protein